MSDWLISQMDQFFNTPADSVHDGVIGHPFLIPVRPQADDYIEGMKFGDTPDDGEQVLFTDIWASARRQEMHVDPDELPGVDPGEYQREHNQWSYYLSAVSNGLLFYVPTGVTKTILSTDKVMPEAKTVTGPAYILELVDSASQSLDIKLNRDLWIMPDQPHRRPRPTVIVYENVEVDPGNPALTNLIKAYMRLEKKQPVWSDERLDALYQSWLNGESSVYARAGFHIGWPKTDPLPGAIRPDAVGERTHRQVRITVYDEFGLPIDLGWLLRHAHKMREDDLFYDVTAPNSYLYEKHPLLNILSYRNIIDVRDEIGRPYPVNFYFDPVQIGNGRALDLDSISGIPQDKQTSINGLYIDPNVIPVGSRNPDHQEALEKWMSIHHHLLAFLPDCPSSAGALRLTGYAGDYHRIGALDLYKWFPEQPNARVGQAPERFHLACRVIPLIDGQTAHGVIADAMRAAYEDDSRADPREDRLLQPLVQREEAKIWLCNWTITPDLFPYGDTPEGREVFDEVYKEGDFADDDEDLEDPNTFERGDIGYPVNSLGYYLQKTIAAGCDVRLLPWYNILGEENYSKNIEICNVINKYYNFDAYHPIGGAVSLPEDRAPVVVDPDAAPPGGHHRGYAIVDHINRMSGSHHQKVSLIKNRYGFIGFLGGIDLQPGRWDTHRHDTDPRKKSPGSGWHDVHTMLQGPVVKDIAKNFIQRWNAFLENRPEADGYPVDLSGIDFIAPLHIPDEAEFWTGPNDLSFADKPKDETDAPRHLDRGNEGVFYGRFTQIAAIIRTIPPFLDQYNTFVAARDGEPLGELGCYQAYKNAIRNARRFIYIEDQYFIDSEIKDLLIERLIDPDPMRRVKKIFVLIPKLLNDNFAIDEINYYYRDKHIKQIKSAVRNFIFNNAPGAYPSAEHVPDAEVDKRFCAAHLVGPDLENDEDDQIYVHAKHMIVDDVWMTISSSNINLRSMTYDSEIGAAVSDAAVEGGSRKAVRDHRIRLWAEHLRLTRKEWFRLLDPIKGLALLLASFHDERLPLIQHSPRPPRYREGAETERMMELIREGIGDPDGRHDGDIMDHDTVIGLLEALE